MCQKILLLFSIIFILGTAMPSWAQSCDVFVKGRHLHQMSQQRGECLNVDFRDRIETIWTTPIGTCYAIFSDRDCTMLIASNCRWQTTFSPKVTIKSVNITCTNDGMLPQ